MGLVEREPQLAALHSWLVEVDGGKGRLVFVSGEAGAGKSSVITEFCASLPAEIPVHWGACEPLSVPRPLGPLMDMAATLDQRVVDCLLAGDRHGAFSATLEALGPGQSSRVVVIEDAHWADESTLDLLQFLARRIGSCRALVLVTFRAEQVGPLAVALGEMASLGLLRRLSVPPLSLAAVRQLATGSGLDAEKLHQETAGNAFFVTEVLRQGLDHVPESVRDAVLARVGRLRPVARAAIEVAAVVGARFKPAAVEVYGVGSRELDECVTAALLVADGRDLVFRHELARQAIIEAILPRRRAELHSVVLEKLRALPADQRPLARLAEHAEEAGDLEAVMEFAPAAGAAAAKLGAHREASLQYARALRSKDLVDAKERAELLERYANECNMVNQNDEAIEAWQLAITLWEQVEDQRRVGDAWRQLTRGFITLGRIGEAREAATRAVEILKPLGPGPELAMAYAQQARLSMRREDVPGAMSWGGKAVPMAEEFGNAVALARALDAIGVASVQAGDASGKALMKRALELTLAEGLDDEAGLIFINLAYVALLRLNPQAAQKYSETGLAFCEDHDLYSHALHLTANQAEACFWSGDWNRAADLYQPLLGRQHVARINALTFLARITSRRQDPQVWPQLDEARQLAIGIGELQFIAPVAAARAEAHWLSGHPESVGNEVRGAYELAVSFKSRWSTGELGWWLWRVGELTSVPEYALSPFALQISGDWESAARDWADHGYPYESAMALADSPNDDDLQAAAASFGALGAIPALEMVRQRLRRMGAAVPRGSRPTTRSNPAQLTSREIEVLAMVKRGMTDPEIARVMFISTRTVNHHVSSILIKLDVKSRAEAAKKAAQLLDAQPTTTRPV